MTVCLVATRAGGRQRHISAVWTTLRNYLSVEAVIEGTIPQNGRGIAVGQYAETSRRFTQEQVQLFGDLILDHNPLHQSMTWPVDKVEETFPAWEVLHASNLLVVDEKANTTVPVVHGMLVASIFSSIFASIAPGAIYRNQKLDFRQPVFVDQEVVGRVQVEAIRPWKRRGRGVVAECETTVSTGNNDYESLLLTGSASVILPLGSHDS